MATVVIENPVINSPYEEPAKPDRERRLCSPEGFPSIDDGRILQDGRREFPAGIKHFDAYQVS